MIRKVRRQTLKDYVLFPALTGPLFPLTLAGNVTANLVRNLWTFNIIFCGHFPAGVADLHGRGDGERDRAAHWYYRQLLGSANFTGSKLLHLMSGNLSYQIEHHLFPDIPARRYPEISAEVREICEQLRPALQHRAPPAARQRLREDRQLALPTKSASPVRPTRSPCSRWRPEVVWDSRAGMAPSDDIGKGEIRKDAVQDAVEAAATTVGQVATIVTGAVRDVARAIGGLGTELFEIRDAARRAEVDGPTNAGLPS